MDMIVTTGNEVPGKKIAKVLSVVKGSTVRARNIGRDIGAGFKSLIGGEIKTYTDMTKDSREEAYNRMVNEAIGLNPPTVSFIRIFPLLSHIAILLWNSQSPLSRSPEIPTLLPSHLVNSTIPE